MNITIDEDVKDGEDEIVNMIAGGAKKRLESTMGAHHLLILWVIEVLAEDEKKEKPQVEKKTHI